MNKQSEFRDYVRAVRKSSVDKIVNNQITNMQHPSRENFQKHLRTVVNGAPSYKERLSGQKDLSVKFKEVDQHIANKTKSAYWNGFIKAATVTGLTPMQTVNFIKVAQGAGMPGMGAGPGAFGQAFTDSAPQQPMMPPPPMPPPPMPPPAPMQSAAPPAVSQPPVPGLPMAQPQMAPVPAAVAPRF